ncbi:hypothetical protein ACFFX0_24195 [Citricoccus parietis]|uniref:Uncharacterized protein n=1 Tax=Citricoccus parietis TaxID=592307 RepID=A0ABV5G6T2_9MICC
MPPGWPPAPHMRWTVAGPPAETSEHQTSRPADQENGRTDHECGQDGGYRGGGGGRYR